MTLIQDMAKICGPYRSCLGINVPPVPAGASGYRKPLSEPDRKIRRGRR